MKRVFTIFLLIFYLIPAIGVSVTIHYCEGKAVSTSISIGLSGNHKCPCGRKEMKKGCCHNETVVYQLDDAQQKAASTNIEPLKEIAQPFPACLIASHTPLFFIEDDVFSSYLPPPEDWRSEPIFLLHRVLVI